MKKPDLDAFIAGSSRNEWIAEPGLAYYVRKSLVFPGVIELSNCSRVGNKVRFPYWRFLKRYEHRVPFIAEQVINDDLAKLYRQRKWLERDLGGTPQFASPMTIERFADDDRFQRMFG